MQYILRLPTILFASDKRFSYTTLFYEIYRGPNCSIGQLIRLAEKQQKMSGLAPICRIYCAAFELVVKLYACAG